MKKINYKSDFDAVLRLKDAAGKEVPFPDCDWEAVFWTFSKSRVFRASCIGGECVNCIREKDGSFRVVFNGHGIGVGILRWEPHFKLPDTLFPDGVRDIYVPMPLDIELVTGAGDYPTTAEVEASLPLIKGDKGERGERGEKGEKGDGFTPAQIAKLDDLPEAETLSARIDAVASASFIDLWNAACGAYGRFNPETGFFELNGITDLTKEQAIAIYNSSVSVLNNSHNSRNCFCRMDSFRTFLPILHIADLTDWTQAFYVCRSLEAVAVAVGTAVVKSTRMFMWCDRLERVIGEMNFSTGGDSRDAFTVCKALESIRIRDINCSLSFQDSPPARLRLVEIHGRHSAGIPHKPHHRHRSSHGLCQTDRRHR